MELSLGKLVIVLLIVLLIFGAGKLPQVMSELGKGIKSLKEGMKGEEKPEIPKPEAPRQVADSSNPDKHV